MNTLIVVKKAGLTIPEGYLQLALDKFPSAIGAASIDGGKVLVSKGPGPVQIEDVRNIQTELKDRRIVFCFQKYNGEMPPDCIQPFAILTPEDAKTYEDGSSEHSLVACLSGTFTNFEKVETPLTAEYYAVDDFLRPQVGEYFESEENDIKKLIEGMKSPSFLANTALMFVGDGQITFFADTDDCFTSSRGHIKKEYDWGIVSDSLGWSPPAAVDPPKDNKTKPKLSLFAKRPATTPQPDAPPIEAPKTDTVIPKGSPLPEGVTVDSSGTKWAQCPKSIQTKDNIRTWYEANAGFKPDGYRNYPKVKINEEQLLVRKKAADDGVLHKDTEPKLVKSSDALPAHEHPPAVSLVPVLTDDQKLAVMEFMDQDDIKATLDINSNQMFDPSKYQDLEAKIQVFTDQVGIKSLMSTFEWKFERLVDLGKNWSTEALALYAMQLRKELRNAWVRIAELSPKDKKPDTTDHQLAKEELKPAATAPTPVKRKGSLFARRAS